MKLTLFFANVQLGTFACPVRHFCLSREELPQLSFFWRNYLMNQPNLSITFSFNFLYAYKNHLQLKIFIWRAKLFIESISVKSNVPYLSR